MEQKNYEANLETALSYLKANQKENASASLKMALSQVPEEEKNQKNIPYLRILSSLATMLIEEGDVNKAYDYIKEGLQVKNLHADLNFLHILLLKSSHRYGEMLTSLISYLIAIDMPDKDLFEYEFFNDRALQEIYDVYIPLSFRNIPNRGPILKVLADTLEKLKQLSSGEYLDKAYQIMLALAEEENA